MLKRVNSLLFLTEHRKFVLSIHQQNNIKMRKTTKLACAAFIAGIPTGISNTYVTVEDGITRLYLFGNHIASKQPDNGIFISNAGYFTNTTKERLNGIPGVTVNQKDGVWYLNGRVWDGEWIKVS